MHVAYEIQWTKSAPKCGYFCVKKFLNQRNHMIVCGAAAIFSAITMCDCTIATKIIRRQKITRYCVLINDLESYSSFARKLLIKWYIWGKIDLKLVSAIFHQIFIFHRMIALQKLGKMFFISSKKLFSFSRYSNFCNFIFLSFFPVSHGFRGWFKKNHHHLSK